MRTAQRCAADAGCGAGIEPSGKKEAPIMPYGGRRRDPAATASCDDRRSRRGDALRSTYTGLELPADAAMIRQVATDDLERVRGFLEAHLDTSLFLLSNLAVFGP